MLRILRFAAIAVLACGLFLLPGRQTSANLGANVSIIV